MTTDYQSPSHPHFNSLYEQRRKNARLKVSDKVIYKMRTILNFEQYRLKVSKARLITFEPGTSNKPRAYGFLCRTFIVR